MSQDRRSNHDAQRAPEAAPIYGPASLSDDQLLSALLSQEGPSPAELLSEHSLLRLIAMGPLELLALGLTRHDIARLRVLDEIRRRTASEIRSRISSPHLTAVYLTPEAAALPVERIGIACLDAQGRVLADLVLIQTHPEQP